VLAFLSNRATAAHLALAAVAPLVLCKYFGYGAICPVLLWIAAVVAVWCLMAPSKGDEERTPAARHRVIKGLIGDPFVWVALVIIGYCAVLAVNDGVALSYDGESALWRLLPPRMPALPGSVSGAGAIRFAVSPLLLVLYCGVAHSLDSRQAVYFGIFGSLIVLLDAVLADAAGIGVPPEDAVAYGLWSLTAAAMMFAAERANRRPKELLAALTLSGCLSAMLASGRATVVVIFAGALLLLSVLFAVCCFRKLRLAGVARAFLLLIVACVTAAVAYHCRIGAWETLLPVWLNDADATLTRLAYANWEAKPWLGVGLGAFPAAAKMIATASDWTVLGPMPDFYGNAWRTLLVERGMVGVIVVSLAVGSLFFAWFRRVRLRGREYFSASSLLLPIAVVAMASSMVFDGSALQVESLMAFAALAALSVNGGT